MAVILLLPSDLAALNDFMPTDLRWLLLVKKYKETKPSTLYTSAIYVFNLWQVILKF